jgi:oxygen-independent coproporphyrinogen III oxidase
MVTAIKRELTLQQSYLGGEEVETIYFGGGTPSILSAADICSILSTISGTFKISANPEVTLEANPDDLTFEKLTDFRSLGINRLSIGIQSFDDSILSYLNRPHNSAAAVQCFTTARNTGFTNISIDLIYAIPSLSEEAWEKNIARAIALEPEHISSYSLTIEKKTVFGNWLDHGKLTAVKDDDAATQLEMLTDQLTRNGFDQYEVSNFGKPGFYSRHNSSYWRQEKYLGVGPSAHSYDGTSRQFNIKNNHLYVKAIGEETIPFEREILTREDRVNDYLLTTLRTSWGCNLDTLSAKFNYNLLGEHQNYLNNLLENELAKLDKNSLQLTNKGKLLADKIASDLFLIAP